MLAIVIPYYKKSYFESALESLKLQSNKNFKVYIGDDASSENPDLILKKYKGDLDFTYKKFDENLGSKSLTQQWKRCLALVKDEEWVMILGDDDVLGVNVVEEFYKAIDEVNKINCNVIRFATQKIDKEGLIISDTYHHPFIEKSTTFLARMYSGQARSSLSEYIFNFNLLKEKGIIEYPLAWYSDVVLVLEISNFKEVYSINNAVMKIRIAEDSITGSKKFNKQKEIAEVYFGRYLLKQLYQFEKSERDILLTKIEKLFFYNKKAISLGFSIISFYIIKFRFAKAFSFIFSTLKSL
jgi:glycosyltransferase involved in cell wall biosynthesis